MDQMILERLTAQEVKRHNIAVSDVEVDKALEDIKRSRGYTDDQLQYVLGQDGKTAEDLRQNLREEIERSRLIQRVLKSKTVITDEEVEARIRNRGPLEQDNRRRLALILLSGSKESGRSMEQARELARQIHERLEKGEDFAKLARQYSQGPAVEDGGDIGFITSDELAPPIEKATRGLEPGEFTEVVETVGSSYIFKVLDVQGPLEAGAMNAEAREQVRKRPYQEEMNRKYEEWIRELEKRSFIKIHLKPSEGAS
jgi:peptidyl-prolyl cis-trans isomerase SurA